MSGIFNGFLNQLPYQQMQQQNSNYFLITYETQPNFFEGGHSVIPLPW